MIDANREAIRLKMFAYENRVFERFPSLAETVVKNLRGWYQ